MTRTVGDLVRMAGDSRVHCPHPVEPMNDYRWFWGKARPSDRDSAADAVPWHPAAYHCLDVAAAAVALLHRGVSWPPSPWQTSDAVLSLAALLALHDIGKFSRPFQAKAPEFWPDVLGSLRDVPPDQGHGAVGLAMLSGSLSGMLESILSDWAPSDRAALLGAVCGHHGRPVDGVVEHVSDKVACVACWQAAREFVGDVFAALEPAPLVCPARGLDPALTWWLAGFAVLADWVGSSETWFRYRAPDLDLATYWRDWALPLAENAVAAAGIMPSKVRPNLALVELVGAEVSASPVQALAGSLDLGEAGPVLVLIEDQTGSGKTEAALLLAHRLMAACRADGLFVALPTMATANAMYARLAIAYRRLFADDATPSLVLAHGGRRVHGGFQDSILRTAAAAIAPPLARQPAAEDEPASAQCAAWVADDRRRAFLASVGVGTIDQALLAVLPTRHAPLRLLGLHRRVLIVDEAHAYDPYMHQELLRLIAFQAGLGGHTIILSATLPAHQRRALAGALPRPRRAQPPPLSEQAYPLVTVLRPGSAQEIPCAGRTGLSRRVVVERLATVDQAAARIAEAARAGNAVAWVRNAVDDAVEAHATLGALGVEATLFHARFAMGDRQAIEAQVMRRFGKQGADRAGVVVATQVIEQSLDIDFDLMVTDLAPLDLLIQRAGRVWRHDRPGRPAKVPRLLVLLPEPVAAPAPDWLGPALRRTGFVYQDHALLWRSAREIFAAGEIAAPGDVRRLVEAAYDPDGEVPAGLQRRADKAEGQKSAEKSLAWQNLLKWEDGYRLNAGAWASDIRTPTRLGDEGTRFRLARLAAGVLHPWCEAETPELAWSLSEITLRPWMATGVPPSSEALAQAEVRARAEWGAWERELPILALSKAAEGWSGLVLQKDRVVSISYDRRGGLRRLPA
jgi:CRISPR-associated endonuclease/helicase Cas3